VVGILSCVAVGVWAADRAKILSIEGATTTYQVQGQDGQPVTVELPSRSAADVEVSKMAPAATKGAAGTVQATVTAIDTETQRVKVRTQEGQSILLEVPAASLKGMQIGEPLTLVIPQRPR
jgi:hypothetical protein